MKSEFSLQSFEEYLNITFRENPFMGAEFFSCGRKHGTTNSQTDMTKLIAAFRNFGNTPKMTSHYTFKPTSNHCTLSSLIVYN
jgi:hypothetical protein